MHKALACTDRHTHIDTHTDTHTCTNTYIHTYTQTKGWGTKVVHQFLDWSGQFCFALCQQIVQLERDLQQVLDEKQDLVTERDAYRHKHKRLNVELNYILKGDERRVVDIDALITENK